LFSLIRSTDRADTARKRPRRSRATSRATPATNKTNHQETTALPRSRMINNVSENRFDSSSLSPPVFFFIIIFVNGQVQHRQNVKMLKH
jgi:hypothetical protein